MLVTFLAVMASVGPAANAGPITGTIVMTVAPAPAADGDPGPGIRAAAVYSSGTVDIGSLPKSLPLAGPPLGFYGGVIEDSVKTTFELRITFNGASGSHPSVDVTGSLSGSVALLPSPTVAYSSFDATPQSAILRGWTPGSGVPLSLIDQYLNTSNYEPLHQGFVGQVPPDTGTFWLTVNPPAAATVPEQSTLLLYLVPIAGLGLRAGARAWRSPRARRGLPA
jgi:hypothetical protein